MHTELKVLETNQNAIVLAFPAAILDDYRLHLFLEVDDLQL